VFPADTVALVGLTMTATGVALTVRVAGLLLTLPAPLLTITVNWLPLSEIAVAGVVKVIEVAPLMATPLFSH
jgi:hypothetical protein